jgi:hypothetical protein
VQVNPVNMRDAEEIERAVAAFARSPNGGLIVPGSGLAVLHRDLIIIEGLNEQGRSRDHESSDEGDQTRKQHYVAQEHTHTRLPLHLFCAGRLAEATDDATVVLRFAGTGEQYDTDCGRPWR